MIELSSKVWVYGMWFVGGKDNDWMACLRKVEGKWRVDYRFRYYKDDKAFDSQDRKSWSSFIAENEDLAVEPLVDVMHQAAQAVSEHNGHPVDFLLLECQGDDPKVMFHMGLRDHIHMRTEKKADGASATN